MRLFVAVAVPPLLRGKAAALGLEMKQEGLGLVRADNMHLTLKFIGETGPKDAEEIKKKLQAVKFGKFRCGLRGVGVFPSEDYVRVVWAGAESGGALEDLAQKVMGALRGFGKDERFTAHLTIARVKKKVDMKSFLELHKNEDFGSFEVAAFELIESRLGGQHGPEYHTLAVFEAEE